MIIYMICVFILLGREVETKYVKIWEHGQLSVSDRRIELSQGGLRIKKLVVEAPELKVALEVIFCWFRLTW